MFDEIAEAARRGDELAVIVPLGPKAHYSLLARMINDARLSLEHITYFGMDPVAGLAGAAAAVGAPVQPLMSPCGHGSTSRGYWSLDA
jgi:hypothetical protein